MANCSVKQWNSELIGEPTNSSMPTVFTTKLFTMGEDFSKKKLVYVALTLNWDKDVKFTVSVRYRKDINSQFKNWNNINTYNTFENYGLSVNTDGTTSYDGGATFILPYNNHEDSIVKLFHNIQFEFFIFIFKQNSTGTGNVAINDISVMYRKLRDYSVVD